jgi:flagellar basal body-associated protein FliL
LREHGESSDEINTTPLQSKVYTDTPATRSPVLTVVLAILILAVLTAGALAALHWFQKRAAVTPAADQEKIQLTMYNDLTPKTNDLTQCC